MHNNNTIKNNIISSSVDCCVVIAAPLLPPLSEFVYYCIRVCIRLVVVFCFHRIRPQQLPRVVLFLPNYLPSFSADCCLFVILLLPDCPRPHPDWLLCYPVCWCGIPCPYASVRRWKTHPVTSFVHLWMALLAVILTAMAAESIPPTPPPVA